MFIFITYYTFLKLGKIGAHYGTIIDQIYALLRKSLIFIFVFSVSKLFISKHKRKNNQNEIKVVEIMNKSRNTINTFGINFNYQLNEISL